MSTELVKRSPEYADLIIACKADFVKNAENSIKGRSDLQKVEGKKALAEGIGEFSLERSFDEIVKIVEAKYPEEDQSGQVLREIANGGISVSFLDGNLMNVDVKPVMKKLFDETSLNQVIEQLLKGRALAMEIHPHAGYSTLMGSGAERLSGFALWKAGKGDEKNPGKVSLVIDKEKYKHLGAEEVVAAEAQKAEREAEVAPMKEKALAEIATLIAAVEKAKEKSEADVVEARKAAEGEIQLFNEDEAKLLAKALSDYEDSKKKALEALEAYTPTDTLKNKHAELVGVLKGEVKKISQNQGGYSARMVDVDFDWSSLKEAVKNFKTWVPAGNEEELKAKLDEYVASYRGKEMAEERNKTLVSVMERLLGVVKGETTSLKVDGYSYQPDDLTVAYGFESGVKKHFHHNLDRYEGSRGAQVKEALTRIYHEMVEKQNAERKLQDMKNSSTVLKKAITAEEPKMIVGQTTYDVRGYHGFSEVTKRPKESLGINADGEAKPAIDAVSEVEKALLAVATAESEIMQAKNSADRLNAVARKEELMGYFKELLLKDPDFATAFSMNISLQQRSREAKIHDFDRMLWIGGLEFAYSDFGTFDSEGRFAMHEGDYFDGQKRMKALLADFDTYNAEGKIERPPVFVDEVRVQVAELRTRLEALTGEKLTLEAQSARLQAVVDDIQGQLSAAGAQIGAERGAAANLSGALKSAAEEKSRLLQEKQGVAGQLAGALEAKQQLEAQVRELSGTVETLRGEVAGLRRDLEVKRSDLSQEQAKRADIERASVEFFGAVKLGNAKTFGSGKSISTAMENFTAAVRKYGILNE